MATFDNSYSRMIAGLKIIFPLLALVLLSTLFLVSRPYDPSPDIPYVDTDHADTDGGQRVKNLSYSGVSESGSAITLTADVALPELGNMQKINAENLKSVIDSGQGQTVSINAPIATFDNNSQTAVLKNGVTVTTSTGYHIQTDTIIADFDVTRMSTPGSITADGPLGHLKAGQMMLQQQSGDGSSGKYELVFKQGVELVYTP